MNIPDLTLTKTYADFILKPATTADHTLRVFGHRDDRADLLAAWWPRFAHPFAVKHSWAPFAFAAMTLPPLPRAPLTNGERWGRLWVVAGFVVLFAAIVYAAWRV